MNVEIERFSFFKNSEGENLRFSESSPKKECRDHRICNCTRNVAVKPESIPSQISTSCKIRKTYASRDIECAFSSRFPFVQDYIQFNFTARWEEEGLEDAHAYFWQSLDHFKVEVSKKGCSFEDIECFLGGLFFGNKVDVSNLMNGHSPSRIVDLSSIDANDLWVHYCHWGNEAMKILPRDEEADSWWKLYRDSVELNKRVEPFLSLDFSVDEIRDTIEKDSILLASIERIFQFLDSMITNISETNLFKLSVAAEKEAIEKEGHFFVDSTTGRITSSKNEVKHD